MNQLPPAALAQELGDCMRDVSSIDSPVAFAYPDGCYESGVISKVEATGFSSAVTCAPGCIEDTSDPMQLPRVFVATPRG